MCINDKSKSKHNSKILNELINIILEKWIENRLRKYVWDILAHTGGYVFAVIMTFIKQYQFKQAAYFRRVTPSAVCEMLSM